MIKKVEMFTVVCDNCGIDKGANSEYSCWHDKETAEDQAMESGWMEDGGKHYCDYCWSHDDNDQVVIDESRKDCCVVKHPKV